MNFVLACNEEIEPVACDRTSIVDNETYSHKGHDNVAALSVDESRSPESGEQFIPKLVCFPSFPLGEL